MKDEKKSKPYLVVMAMRGEAAPLIRALGLTPVKNIFGPQLPTIGYSGRLPSGRRLYLVLSGVDRATKMDMIGTQMASLAAVLAVRRFKPSAVFNFGTCGALAAKGAAIGEVYLCRDKVWFHTQRIPMPGWDKYSWGGFRCPKVAGLARRHGFKTGVLSTSGSLDYPPFDAERFERVGAHIGDMEGAAIAWVASLHGLPYYGLKAVTDLMDLPHKTGEQFQNNFKKVVTVLTEGALRLLNDGAIA